MNSADEWSPDEPLGAEANEQWDKALDAGDEVQPGGPARAEGERSLDRQLVADEAELEEAGAQLDDPEQLAVLDGGMDDPDGSGVVSRRRATGDDAGWDLDAEEQVTNAQLDAEGVD